MAPATSGAAAVGAAARRGRELAAARAQADGAADAVVTLQLQLGEVRAQLAVTEQAVDDEREQGSRRLRESQALAHAALAAGQESERRAAEAQTRAADELAAVQAAAEFEREALRTRLEAVRAELDTTGRALREERDAGLAATRAQRDETVRAAEAERDAAVLAARNERDEAVQTARAQRDDTVAALRRDLAQRERRLRDAARQAGALQARLEELEARLEREHAARTRSDATVERVLATSAALLRKRQDALGAAATGSAVPAQMTDGVATAEAPQGAVAASVQLLARLERLRQDLADAGGGGAVVSPAPASAPGRVEP